MAVRITQTAVWLTVGIIFLAAVVLGGLYIVKGRGEQARRADALEVAQQNLEAQSQTGTTPSIDGEVENSGTTTEGTENSDSSESQTDSTNGSAPEGTASEDPDVQGAATASPDELPQTSTIDAAPALVLALLAFTAASYIGSRRTLAKLNQQ